MKVLLNIISSNRTLSYNAVNKARTDVERTLVSEGYEVIEIVHDQSKGKIRGLPRHLIDIFNTVRKLRKLNPTDIIIQYPGFRLGIRAIGMVTRLLKKKNVTLLIHDLDTLRVYGNLGKREVKILNRSSRVIVHTDSMAENLKGNGVKSPLKILWLFDYYTDGEGGWKEGNAPYSIVFAGNLKKSEFLRKIGDSLSPHILYLYGLPIDYEWPEGLEYEGKFAPDDIKDIKGDWGLVWDGDDTSTCSGLLGEYLQYNSSHKVSLYIVSGKPLIVWSKSALADYLVKNRLAVAVDSLEDIPARLAAVSEEEYRHYVESVNIWKEKLRNGEMLRKVLKQ